MENKDIKEITSVINGDEIHSSSNKAGNYNLLIHPGDDSKSFFHDLPYEKIINAIDDCKKAQKKWALTSYEERKDILCKYASLMKDEVENLARLIAIETGKPFWETKTEANAVIAKVAISIKSYEERTKTELNQTSDHSFSALTHRPIGVFAVLGPFNFPAHLPNGHIIPALLAGNGIVFKPSNFTPESGKFIVRKLIEAGVPAPLLQVVIGGVMTGEIITDPKLIDGVLFTGSPMVGKIIHKKFAEYPNKIVALEMGGNNPLICWDGENIDDIAMTIINSAFLSAGQRCTCARRLILPSNDFADNIINKLEEICQNIIVSRPFEDPEPFMGSVINSGSAQNLLAKAKYISNECGKAIVPLSIVEGLPEYYLRPSIYEITNPDKLEDEEDFGPILKIFKTDNFENAIKLANDTKYGLSAGLISEDENKWKQFYSLIKAGIVNWNQQTTGASSAYPFGGPGFSGNFRPSAFYAADYCAYPMATVANKKCPQNSSKPKGIK